MTLRQILRIIEEHMPAKTAMEKDRVGLQIQSGIEEVHSILTAYEVNDETIEEAVGLKCDLIITFHPLIFHPLTRIEDGERVGRLCSKLIRNEIALVSIHTNFDAYPAGTSRLLGEEIGLKFESHLKSNPDFENYGMGFVGSFDKELSTEEFLQKVCAATKGPLRYSKYNKNGVSSVAILGGSGSSFYDDALQSGADAFVTADLTYHDFHRADGKILLVDAGHFETERYVRRGLARFLSKRLENVETHISKINTNPVRYYAGGVF